MLIMLIIDISKNSSNTIKTFFCIISLISLGVIDFPMADCANTIVTEV